MCSKKGEPLLELGKVGYGQKKGSGVIIKDGGHRHYDLLTFLELDHEKKLKIHLRAFSSFRSMFDCGFLDGFEIVSEFHEF